jgi:hypothetical protein
MGDVVAGTARHGYDLELRRYNGRGWRAVVLVEGRRALLRARMRAAGGVSRSDE